MTVALEEHVRQGRAEGGVTQVDRDDVSGRGLNSHSGIEQGGAGIVHMGSCRALSCLPSSELSILTLARDPASTVTVVRMKPDNDILSLIINLL